MCGRYDFSNPTGIAERFKRRKPLSRCRRTLPISRASPEGVTNRPVVGAGISVQLYWLPTLALLFTSG